SNLTNLESFKDININGYHSAIVNNEGFQGNLPLYDENFKFILRSKKINTLFKLTSRVPVDLLIAAKKASQELGAGLSGSAVKFPGKNEIIGIFHSSIPSLKGKFKQLS